MCIHYIKNIFYYTYQNMCINSDFKMKMDYINGIIDVFTFLKYVKMYEDSVVNVPNIISNNLNNLSSIILEARTTLVITDEMLLFCIPDKFRFTSICIVSIINYPLTIDWVPKNNYFYDAIQHMAIKQYSNVAYKVDEVILNNIVGINNSLMDILPATCRTHDMLDRLIRKILNMPVN